MNSQQPELPSLPPSPHRLEDFTGDEFLELAARARRREVTIFIIWNRFYGQGKLNFKDLFKAYRVSYRVSYRVNETRTQRTAEQEVLF